MKKTITITKIAIPKKKQEKKNQLKKIKIIKIKIIITCIPPDRSCTRSSPPRTDESEWRAVAVVEVDGWMDGWIDGWMDGRMDRRMSEKMNGCIERWMNG